MHAICHFRPPASLIAFAAVILAPPAIIVATPHCELPTWRSLTTFFIYIVSLSCSITIYRLLPFHPLARYPGPILARISRLWATWRVVNGKQHIDSHQLFLRYGDVVRTGPNHLIIRNASAIPALHGSKDRWLRTERYHVHLPYDAGTSLLEIMDIPEHAKRRRIWERAFTPGAIKSYKAMLQFRLNQLVDTFTAHSGDLIDVSEWIGFFTLDFMGDFAFGGIFKYMKHGSDYDGLQHLLETFIGVSEALGTIPWTRPLLGLVSSSQAMDLERMGERIAEKRMAEGSQVQDLFHYLLSEDANEDAITPKMTSTDLRAEAMLAIGAGSDTTATALSNAMFYLISHPATFTRLREELDHASGAPTVHDQAVDPSRLADLSYLQAVINETLRLQPAVPNGVPRKSPVQDGAVALAQYIISPGTIVQVPTWSLHRDSRYFSPNPEDFWPERWLPEEGPKVAEARGQEFILNQGAYTPFHYGPANCAGRALALHKMRTVLATFVRRFDFAFAPGFEAKDWTDQLEDRFLMISLRGPLKVVVTIRD